MKSYSAMVHSYGKVRFKRNFLYENKASFIRVLREIGYQVNPKHVKETALFDYIMQHPDYNDDMWNLHSIPKEGVQG